MKSFLMKYTIISDGNEFIGLTMGVVAKSQLEAEGTADMIARHCNLDVPGNFGLLHDHTTQSIRVDSVQSLTQEEAKVLAKFLII